MKKNFVIAEPWGPVVALLFYAILACLAAGM